MIVKDLYSKRWSMVLGAAFVLACLNMNPAVHSLIINVDTQVAYKMNSIIGINPVFDKTLAWLSTRVGDAVVLSCICSLFLMHSLRAPNLKETVERLSFWAWLGVLCLTAYAISCASEYFIKRDTPIIALNQFKNLQTIYGVTLHSCPTSSFPSGHGLAYIFFAMMSWQRYFRMSLVLWCLTIIMLSIRLIVGLHWLSDIVLGSLLMSLLLVSLVDDTSLKNTYKVAQQAVSVIVGNLFVWYNRLKAQGIHNFR